MFEETLSVFVFWNILKYLKNKTTGQLNGLNGIYADSFFKYTAISNKMLLIDIKQLLIDFKTSNQLTESTNTKFYIAFITASAYRSALYKRLSQHWAF